MKKHIIISNYDDLNNPYYAGGGAVAIHETARRLSEKFTVTVLTGKYPGSKNTKKDGIIYQRIGVSFGGPKIGQLLFQFMLPWYVVTKEFDLLLESFTPPFSTGLLQFFTKKPVIGLVHMLSGKDMRRKYHLPFDRIEQLGLKTYRYFITTSEQTKQRIKEVHSNASISVIPNGVDKMVLPRNSRKKYILYLGRIEVDQKGIDLLLKAFKRIAIDMPYTLVIAGAGEENQIAKLNDLIDKLKLHDSVQVVGRVDDEAKKKLLKDAVCIVVPSRFETFSLVSLESLAAGIPLITFSIEGLSWIPKRARITVPAFSIEALAKAIKRVTTDKKLRETVIRNGKAISETMSWSSVSQSYERYINNVLTL